LTVDLRRNLTRMNGFDSRLYLVLRRNGISASRAILPRWPPLSVPWRAKTSTSQSSVGRIGPSAVPFVIVHAVVYLLGR